MESRRGPIHDRRLASRGERADLGDRHPPTVEVADADLGAPRAHGRRDAGSPGAPPTAGSDPDAGPGRRPELRWALAGGAFATGGVFGVTAWVGRVSAFEARRLVEGIKPTATFAASTYIGAGATVIALMATMIAFSISHESEFRSSHYRRLRVVATATTALIITALALLTVLVVPIADTDAPANGYVVVYWSILVLGSIGGGLTVTIVLMLNYTVRGLIELGVRGTSHLVISERESTDGSDESGAPTVAS